jgi:hypothetical protein
MIVTKVELVCHASLLVGMPSIMDVSDTEVTSVKRAGTTRQIMLEQGVDENFASGDAVPVQDFHDISGPEDDVRRAARGVSPHTETGADHGG